ncbi:hypothetical protein SAMN05660653_01115 [Desulfonatronum thiosulfatophilum]|uniref:Uncharacterized protein n=1 Tax=Desulfonatronum thiosulfatophilum TaxID=617002 RepID=A0A1G6BQD6_9BACT|nr:hypothetical protein SAMN05660653_01115 [Desulfonatronum thiosulfatophilum]
MSMAEVQRANDSRKVLQLSELKTESAALENQFNSFWRSL